ncbi:MAG: PAS domain-containing protein [Nitrospirae bacterium]|nr:PAS domain-containing protein [Nitrospirota bacterium]
MKSDFLDLERLFRFSQDITATTDLKKLYRSIVEHSKDMLALDYSTVMLLSDDKASLVVFDTLGFPGSYIGTFQLTEGQGLSTLVIKTRRPETVPDFLTETRFQVPDVVFEKDIRSAVCVPMMLGDDIFGVLIGHTYGLRSFSEEEIQLYQNMGNLAAIAIKNAMNIEMLEKARDEWELTFNSVPDLIAQIDSEYRIVRINRAMAEKLAMPPAEAIGRHCYELVHDTKEPVATCPHRKLLADGKEHSCELYEERLGGEYWVSVTPFFSGDGKPAGSIHIARNVSEIRQTQRAMESERKFLQTIIDGITDPIMVIDTNYRVQLMNRAANSCSRGGTYMPGSGFCYEISHGSDTPCSSEEHPCPLREARTKKEAVIVTHRHLKKDFSEHVVEIHASPIFDEQGEVLQIIEVSRDVTEKLKMEELRENLARRLAQEQKEESISTLAGGMAHDFNNILMGVLGNAELLRMRLENAEKERVLADNIIQSAQRMADLTNQLLAYAKGGMYQPKIMFVNSAILEALNMSHKGKALDIEVKTELADDIWPVFADPGQITQVMLNLFNNAFEAMEKAGGCLAVTTVNKEDRDSWQCLSFKHSHAAGDYVHISISDTGPGIPRPLQERIFEPFFTTKFLGRGLGLAAAAGIIQNHCGCISVDSKKGAGAAFDIFLPRALSAAEELMSGLTPPAKEETPVTILVVDDEPQIIFFLEEVLRQLGYNVLAVDSGIKALELFRDEKDAIELAILDIQMPDMDGNRLFQEIKTIKPELKVIISSGYDEKTALAEMEHCRPDSFIQKPYQIAALEKKLQELLGT